MCFRLSSQALIKSLFRLHTEGENKMQKESIGRLLLSLLTAFIMVVGVFSAAVYNNVYTGDEGSVTSTDIIAPSEPEIGRSEAGDAPASANDRDTQLPTNMRQPSTQTSTVIPLSDVEDRNDQNGNSRVSPSTSSAGQTQAEPHGTRIAPGAYVDAGGPYGTESNPMNEGDATVFWATIHDDDPLNYEYRWDINDDGEYESDWSSDPFYFHTFIDDHQGVARVQAFDGTSTMVTKTGIPLQEDTMMSDVRYWSGYVSVTWAWEFETSQEVRITDLGFYRDDNIYGYMGAAPEYVYKLTIWDLSGNRLVELSNPSGFPYTDDTWNWFSVSPAYSLAAGTYRVSCHAYTSSPTWYENLFPGVNHPGSSPDGIVEMNARYVIWDDQYPYLWDGDWGLPALDFKYEYDEVTEIYLEDTADVYVANVAPEVTDATASVTDGLEGTAVEFSAKFTDPGIGDDWWFRYDWGDGEVTDWIKIPKYKFDEPVNNVLYLYDGPTGRNFGGMALDEIGLEYTEVFWDTELEDELESGVEWDLVVVQNPYYYWGSGAFDALNDYVEAGGKLIINTWLTSYYPSHDLWNNLGAYYGWDYYMDSPNIYEWDTSHAIFNAPNSVPTLEGTDIYTYLCGQYLEEIYGFGNPVGGYYPTDDPYAWYEAGLVARLDGQTIWNAFTPCNYNSDSDGDGQIDMQELFVNEIVWILGGIAVQPWPEPLELPAYPHIFKDDHPVSLTDSDQFNVRIEVKDDDYREEVNGPGNLIEQDFEDGFGDWSQGGGWELLFSYNAGDGQTAQAWYYMYYPFGGPEEDSLLSPVMDAGTSSDLVLEFEHFWWSDYPWSPYQDGYVEGSIDGGSTWPYLIDEFHMNNPGYEIATKTYDISSWADGESQLQIRFRMSVYDNWVWEVDNVKISGNIFLPGIPGMGSDDCWVTIHNVFPETSVPAEFVDVVQENGIVNFGVTDGWGFIIEDPAMKEESENFWYRIDYGDGIVSEWQKTAQLVPGLNMGNLMVTGIPMDFPLELNLAIDGPQQLMYNYLMFCMGDTGTVLCSDSGYWMQSFTPDTMEDNLNNNFGTNYDFIYDNTGTALVAGGMPLYDMLYFSYDYEYEGGAHYTADEVLEYMMAGGHVFVPGDEFLNGPIYFLPYYVENQVEFYLDFPGPAYTGWIEDIISDSVTTGSWGFSYCLHSTLPDYDPWEFIPVFADPSPTTTLIRVGGDAYSPKNLILPETHVYGDNGVYTVNMQIIDDDMWWDLSGEQPEFMGTGDPEDWISHNRFDVEIENTDPVISPDIYAYAELDLRLRMSGTKTHEATMSLVENGVEIGYCEVTREPGAPNIGVISNVDLMVTKDYEYELTITVDPQGDGGSNPTWIFDMVFPDGKFKEFKHTFNDEHGWTWTITDSELKGALLGHDIIFEATARDVGSDDLAFVWNFGDCTPHGIHLYANVNQGAAVEGVSDEAEVLFTQLGTNADPWFKYDANDDRSPWGGSIGVTDTITHVFDENQPYYYFVTLIVMDDDVEEPYPSTQLHPTPGLDYYHVEVNLG